ncbi:MAG: ThiF family adenylyltransferase [Actinomycetia bacterium]|nr:ThiF family adenylyltransferase [Actinomycetes bacterium]
MQSGYELAREQLREIAEASSGTVQIVEETTQPSGYLWFDVSIRFDGLRSVEHGLSVRAREPFRIVVPPAFPYKRPSVVTLHRRFAGFPHVQWGYRPCLYQSSVEWKPEDGMYGFITRLDSWVRDAALNNLDPDDAPLHPPVAYPTVSRLVVPRIDTPVVEASPWFGFAELRQRGHRTEIIDWRPLSEARPEHFALAILLHEPFPFEYPETTNALLNELESHGIDWAPFVLSLALLANHAEAGTPLTVVLGTPMRRVEGGGRALQHLAVWEISGEDADRLREMQTAREGDEADKREDAIEKVVQWSVKAEVGWCSVSEGRPEATQRRDQASPMAWFRGKRVAIWGCGAIGTYVAESVVRAGAARVELVDNEMVGPGLLVRQGFEDSDIGRWKAEALADRLSRIEPDLETKPLTRDLIEQIGVADPIPDVDLVIDCTASSAVRMRLEQTLRGVGARPPIASMAASGDASVAMATLSTAGHSGGPLDLIRRLKLETCRKTRLSRLREGFWPTTPPGERFQPEPGCSEPTFVGSNADLAGLSARMLNAVARALPGFDEGQTGAGWLFEEQGPVHAFSWPPDLTLQEKSRGYSVRVSPEAVREIRAWARRSVRTAGPTVETGGLVFGELNEAAGVLWVTEAEGPPPDSDADTDHFTCGTEGMQEAADEKAERFGDSVACVGSWHTHPTTRPYPSKVDLRAVAQLLTEPGSARQTFVLLILSGSPDDPELGAHAFRTTLRAQGFVRIEHGTAATTRVGQEPEKSRNVGLALSGGGSRAIAFHLGCLRALDDLGLLGRLQVVSSVSGGSVIAAMYAYSNDSFAEFDARVVALLSQGLTGVIVRAALRPSSLVKTAWSLGTAGAISGLRMLIHLVPPLLISERLDPGKPPPIRTFSRSEAFRDAIEESLFGDTLVRDVARDSLDTVINATELRTGSAFRFGSRQSGCWRLGTINPRDALVADAVAASAAYPALLPTLDRSYRFTKSGVTSDPERVLLTDGGVFENLGISPMEPGREPSISTNVFKPAYIISCDAGTGLFDADSHPIWSASRMRRSFQTVFRKTQDATRNRLHQLTDSGNISGFALSYLGQDDNRLPWLPPALPTREEVYEYPTDFSPMNTADIDRLALRGELLTRLLIAYYLPEL